MPSAKLRSAITIVALVLLALLLVAGGTGGHLGFRDLGLNRNFDPAVIADAETRMWQAYYTRDNQALGLALVSLLGEQFGLSYVAAAQVGEQLALGAAIFSQRGPDHEANATSTLVDAYALLRDAVDGSWDPAEAARLEVQWWVDRRTPGRDSPEQVGQSIASLYELFYGEMNPDLQEAGRLRAEAAALRDAQQQQANWPRIQALLEDS